MYFGRLARLPKALKKYATRTRRRIERRLLSYSRTSATASTGVPVVRARDVSIYKLRIVVQGEG